MKYLAFASLAVFVMLTSITDASAVVCARGVYRAGCAGPRGAVVAPPWTLWDAYTRGECGIDLPGCENQQLNEQMKWASASVRAA